ncbi:hypothetical protein L3X38_033699 [Prunus dulcis]|uniref:Uncharacterized protein n=1 Tax=Prunus dulcis TaxID=3755 RepID=A0AAD4VHH5_PRUDU|nr:hypothetical protein L3X38_033699 [Prunus dulcis]
MVISPNWSLYKEDDVGKARAVKENILDEYFWDNIDYILSFTASIYEMIRMADTDKPSLHLVYEWFYSPEWLQEDPSRVAPHQDVEITRERKKCLEKYFSNDRARRDINVEYAFFSMCLDDFGAIDAMNDRFHMELMEEPKLQRRCYYQMWDIGGDRFDSLGEEGVEMLEIANLYLDEPSLEVALFTGEDITNIVVN